MAPRMLRSSFRYRDGGRRPATTGSGRCAEAGRSRAKISVSYSSTMSRSHPEPTSPMRWMVRHRRGVRVGVVLYIVLGICWTVYVLATGGPVEALAASWMGVISASLILLVSLWNARRYVERYDNARHQDPNSA